MKKIDTIHMHLMSDGFHGINVETVVKMDNGQFYRVFTMRRYSKKVITTIAQISVTFSEQTEGVAMTQDIYEDENRFIDHGKVARLTKKKLKELHPTLEQMAEYINDMQ